VASFTPWQAQFGEEAPVIPIAYETVDSRSNVKIYTVF